MSSRAYMFALAAGILFLAGCGSSTLGRVKGRLTCNGKPVADAVLIFSPIAASPDAKESGKAASASTDADGRFVVTTYRSGDGALVGKHKVSITLDEKDQSGCKSKVVEREVKPGSNDLDIELER